MASTSSALTASFNITSLRPPPPPQQTRQCLLPLRLSAFKLTTNGSRVSMSAVQKKEFNLGGATASLVVLAAAAVIPEIAEAAQPGISPSLKNLLLSVVAGGVVLLIIGGAVTAVATFDPVTRK